MSVFVPAKQAQARAASLLLAQRVRDYFTSETHREVIAEVPWETEEIVLQLGIEGERFAVRYGETKEALKELCVADGTRINPEKVGCMTGTMIGMFASGNGEDCENQAEFGWFEMK